MRFAFEPIYTRPLIIIKCNKRPLRCVLDTGYPGTLWMSMEMAARYGIHVEEGVHFAKAATGIDLPYRRGYARAVIHPVIFENIPIDVHEGTHVEHALLGTSALRNFRVILDFKDEFTDLQHIE